MKKKQSKKTRRSPSKGVQFSSYKPKKQEEKQSKKKQIESIKNTVRLKKEIIIELKEEIKQYEFELKKLKEK